MVHFWPIRHTSKYRPILLFMVFFKVPHCTTQSLKLRGEKIMHKISVEPPSTLSPSFFRATPQKVRRAAKRSLQYAEEAFSKSSLSAAFFPPPMASNILILRAHSNINLQDMRRLILYVPSTIMCVYYRPGHPD